MPFGMSVNTYMAYKSVLSKKKERSVRWTLRGRRKRNISAKTEKQGGWGVKKACSHSKVRLIPLPVPVEGRSETRVRMKEIRGMRLSNWPLVWKRLTVWPTNNLWHSHWGSSRRAEEACGVAYACVRLTPPLNLRTGHTTGNEWAPIHCKIPVNNLADRPPLKIF